MNQSEGVVLCEFLETGIAGVDSLSPFCTKVRMALAVAQIPFSSKRAARPDAFKDLSPAAQLPVLVVEGAVIPDSTAILTRIELLAPDAFDRGLDARSKAESWLWEEMADSVLNGFLVASRWADDANWPAVSQALFGTAPWFVQKLVAPRIRKHVRSALRARDVIRQGDDVLWRRFEDTLDRMELRAPLFGILARRGAFACRLGHHRAGSRAPNTANARATRQSRKASRLDGVRRSRRRRDRRIASASAVDGERARNEPRHRAGDFRVARHRRR